MHCLRVCYGQLIAIPELSGQHFVNDCPSYLQQLSKLKIDLS